MIIIAAVLIVICLALLIWAGINIVFNIAELIIAIVRKEKAQIVLHAIQLGVALLVVAISAFTLFGGER